MYDCICQNMSPDKLNLLCVDCGKLSHAWCYSINFKVEGLEHCCGKCAHRLNKPCTDAKIKKFFARKPSQTELDILATECQEKRVVFSYAEGEYKGFLGMRHPNANYIWARFDIDKEKSLAIVKELCFEGYISAPSNKFVVNFENIRMNYGYNPIKDPETHSATTLASQSPGAHPQGPLQTRRYK